MTGNVACRVALSNYNPNFVYVFISALSLLSYAVKAFSSLGNVFSKIASAPYLIIVPIAAWYSPYRQQAAIVFGIALLLGIF